jgi:hypothetical protein
MRGTYQEISRYLTSAAVLLERYGVTLRLPGHSDELELLEDPSGRLSFELLGDLPSEADPGRSEIAVREEFRPLGGGRYERSRYEYEIIDRERDHRRAFHLHFPEWFERTFMVVVHEHCEQPVGHVACPHYEGSPIRDAYAGIVALMRVWTDPAPDCAELRCLG